MLLPLLGLLLFGIEENSDLRRTSLLNNMRQTASAAGLLVDDSLQQARGLAQTVAAEAASHGMDLQVLRGFIERLVRDRPDLLNVAAFDTQGQPLVSATPWPQGSRISDRDYFQQALEQKQPVVSELILGRRVQQPSVVAAAPILGEGQRVLGVITVSLRLDTLEQRMLDIGLRPGQAVFVTDPLGRLVFHTSRLASSWEARDLSGLLEVQQARTGETVLSTDFHGLFRQDPRIAALVPSAQHGWIVGVTWGTREAFEGMHGIHRMQLAAFLAIALLVLAGAWMLATYLSGRVSRLVEQTRTVSRGELNQWAPIEPSRLGTGDELDELTRAFNHMACALKVEGERRETFLSSVAHDMKNLTTPLTLTTRLLHAGRQSPEARERALGRLEHQAARIERLVSDLLDASRIGAGHFNLHVQRHDLMKLVRGVVEEQQAAADGHQLVLQGPETLELEADPDRLAQVLTNLVNNAIKYSPEGGAVAVDVSVEQATVTVRVKDSGIGLQARERDEVFQPYARAADTGKIRGLGLGLYICRAIVEAHGGTIRAESPGRGQGSTFLFTLPLRPASTGPA